MRVITAPGVEIKEIDKSQYSPAMTGTNCYVMGFANKGEPYQPMEFTTRSAWTSYYGEPDNEAEKYFYNACTEVLNQNGRLFCARLPYDNAVLNKIVGYDYTVSGINNLSDIGNDYKYVDITEADPTIDKVCQIEGSNQPTLFDLSSVDEYRTDEAKVPAGHFVIIDKTCATYKKIPEDTRKGIDRELIGIMPVVTTAANALYAQKLIQVADKNAKYYESIGNVYVQDDQNAGINGGTIAEPLASANPDLNVQLNSTYKNYKVQFVIKPASFETLGDIYNGISSIVANYAQSLTAMISDMTETDAADLVVQHNRLIDELSAQWLTNEAFSSKVGQLAELSTTVGDTVGDFRDNAEKLYAYYNASVKFAPADGDPKLPDTVSFQANEYFSTIEYDTDTQAFGRDNLKKIGVVVFKAYVNASEGNKISFEPVEAFCGSLYKDDKDLNTGVTTFIDTIINTTSNYIYFFSNCFNSTTMKKLYLNELDMFVATPTGNAGMLGFFESQTKEEISLQKSIYDGMNMCFEKVSDINERDIDIVCDAGVSNIASFIKAIFDDTAGTYDLNMLVPGSDVTVSKMWKCDENNASVKTWKTVVQKLDTFCKQIRKDCMFITECPRPLVLQGQKKIVRPSKPANTIDANILPYVKFVTGLNTNYGAGYMDWFEVADEYTGDFMWLPPSIKAMGVYINTDVNFNYWDAPAGLNRGVIAATDVAFSPNGKQAGAIYEKNWNYAINYPQDGIVLEGQKTFQVKPSAFDRVNVRRLFLRLERQAYKVARYFVYEGNTAYTRQRLVDALDPYFKEAKIGGGIYDYKIICDESTNTPETIDRNELKVKIGIKPVKTSEFILIDFIALTTGGSFEEAMA